MKFFIDEILENEELKAILLDERNAELDARGREIAQQIISSGEGVHVEPGLLQVFAVAHMADHALKVNTRRGIPRDITVATLKDVNNWVKNHMVETGTLGISRLGWLTGHNLGHLLKVGRLQFVYEKASPDFIEKCHVLATHIPQGEPLDFDACLDSFKQAAELFSRLFPEDPPKYFVCSSWLLSPDLPKVVDEGSNICRFMRLWTQTPCEGDGGAQAKERVFGFGFDGNIENAPENTSLQRKLKALILSGDNVRSSRGYIKI